MGTTARHAPYMGAARRHCVSNMGTSWNCVPEMGTERRHVSDMCTAKRHVSDMGMEGDMYQIWVQKETRIIYGGNSKTCTMYGGKETCISFGYITELCMCARIDYGGET
jgi:hypothetical protein